MISNLPKWSWGAFFLLAFSAGMINAVTLIAFTHLGSTHLTGVISQFSIHIASGEFNIAKGFFYAIFFFFLGSLLCGLIIRDAHFQIGRRYGYALALEAVFLYIAANGFRHHATYGLYLSSLAAGLQNALASNFSGAIVRTTHMTGIVTDLGFLVGHLVMGRNRDYRRLRLFLMLLSGFVLGGGVGAFGYKQMGLNIFFLTATFVLLLALIYEFMIRRVSADPSINYTS